MPVFPGEVFPPGVFPPPVFPGTGPEEPPTGPDPVPVGDTRHVMAGPIRPAPQADLYILGSAYRAAEE